MEDFRNCSEWIGKNALIFGAKEAVASDRARLSYSTLNNRATIIAGFLKDSGVKKGDRVCLLMQNDVEFIEIMIGIWKAGAVVVPINYRLSLPEIKYIIEDSEPHLIFYDEEFRNSVSELRLRIRSIEIPDNYNHPESEYGKIILKENHPPFEPDYAGLNGEDIAEILYTAGTTGFPKGVMLTHKNLFYQTVNSWSLGIDPRAHGLVVLPLFHAGGLNGSLLPLLHIGATSYLMRRFDPKRVLEIIEREHVNGMVGVPVMYDLMACQSEFHATDFSSIAALICGGAPLPSRIIEMYRKKNLRFTQGYGLTETSPGATGMTPDEFEKKVGAAGRQLIFTSVKVIDENGNECEPGTEGEITVKGPNVMKGYWKKEEETARVLKNGWFHTGDIGKMDQDGYLFIAGRKKEMIISGGENIYPAEIENALFEYPGIFDAAVIGAPDAKWGEVPVAFVMAAPGISGDSIREFLKTKIGSYKVPSRIIFKTILPRNQAGKLLKNALKEEIWK
jgi:fatty-acyl-CoA synthase